MTSNPYPSPTTISPSVSVSTPLGLHQASNYADKKRNSQGVICQSHSFKMGPPTARQEKDAENHMCKSSPDVLYILTCRERKCGVSVIAEGGEAFAASAKGGV